MAGRFDGYENNARLRGRGWNNTVSVNRPDLELFACANKFSLISDFAQRLPKRFPFTFSEKIHSDENKTSRLVEVIS